MGVASNVGAGVSGVGAGSGAVGSSGFGPMVSSNPAGLDALAASKGVGTAGLPGPGLEVAPNVISPTTPSLAQSGNQSILDKVPTPSADDQSNAQNVKNIFGYKPGDEGYVSNTTLGITGGGAALSGAMGAERDMYGNPPTDDYEGGNLQKLKYDPDKFTASSPTYAPGSVYRPTYAAEGGIMQAYMGGNVGAAANYDDESGSDSFRSGGIARFDNGGLGSLTTGMHSGAGSSAGAQTIVDQGIAALGQAGKKRMMTKEQMDSINLQGMSKAGLQDVYGQMAAQGLAAGGPAGNKDMAAIQDYMAAAQGGDMATVAAKAQAGDYNAMIALNKVRKTPNQNYAGGGHLGGYSDGGRMLKGPGDGMSDNIPATIAGKQPARLADGEFVVPADVVSHLGNGSTDAGAKQLYAMMDRVRKARTGNKKQGKQIKPNKYMVA
jgi:hypothetical protein